MAVKTFTTGEVLTAADTNTYLSNGGLVYITSASFTSTATWSINNCFTSTYSAYRIHVNWTSTTGSDVYIRFRKNGVDAATNYSWVRPYYYSTAVGDGVQRGNGDVYGYVGLSSSAAKMSFMTDIFNPQENVATSYKSDVIPHLSAASPYLLIQWCGGFHSTVDQYDGFSLIPSGGNQTGTVTIYGYRKA